MAGEFKGPLCDLRGTKDVALIERAVRERWPIVDKKRKEITAKLVALVLGQKTSERARVMAARVLTAMDKLNHDGEKLALEVAGVTKGEAAHVTNQQINIYVPANGRGPAGIPKINTNGNGNGHTNGEEH